MIPSQTPAPKDPPRDIRIDTVHLSLVGRPFTVRGEAAVVAEVRRLLEVFVVGPDRSAHGPVVAVRQVNGGYLVTADGHPDAGVREQDEATGQVLAVLNAAALSDAECLAVHAGVVARHGRVVAFPARSGQGKSTLTAACLRAGLDYVSDEALCLDWRDAGVLPYPRPLELSGWSRSALGLTAGPRDELVTAARLGARSARPPLVLDHLVLLARHPAGAATEEVTLEPVSPQQGAAALLTRSFNHWRHPGRAFDLAHEVASRTRVWRLRLGEPTRAAALLCTLLGPG
ncbi:MAG TPA: hypothetical protein VIR27_11010 [Mycobacteriales bacterium]